MNTLKPGSKIIGFALMVLLLNGLASACIVRSNGPLQEGVGGTLESLESALSYQSTELAAQATMLSYLATRSPARAESSKPVTPTPYYPVTGTVIIEDDRCCAGGIAGETIELSVRFEASSPFGEVTDMRVQFGSSPQGVDEIAETPWEPFEETITFPTRVALNWVGLFISVQYRDSAGNLSPVLWDDISIEGMPPPTP
jgi:hypothetical protein